MAVAAMEVTVDMVAAVTTVMEDMVAVTEAIPVSAFLSVYLTTVIPITVIPITHHPSSPYPALHPYIFNKRHRLFNKTLQGTGITALTLKVIIRISSNV
jgi:hypothetical protein